jgi:hypothetical protein
MVQSGGGPISHPTGQPSRSWKYVETGTSLYVQPRRLTKLVLSYKAVFDSGRCTHDETLRLMNACSQDVDEPNNGDDDNNEEDDEESLVEDDSDKEISSNDEESGEDGSDEDGDLSAAFTRDAIGAGGGQLRHVPSTCFLYTFCLCKLIFSCLVRSSALLSQFAGDQMDHVAMIFWIKRQDKLIHDYSLTVYLLSSNPTIMAHAYENRLTMHNDAVCISLTS